MQFRCQRLKFENDSVRVRELLRVIHRDEAHSLLLAIIRRGCQFDHRVQWDFHKGSLLARHVHEVSIYYSENTLVAHNHDRVGSSLDFVDYHRQPINDVQIGFPPRVAVAELVLSTSLGLVTAATTKKVKQKYSF